MTDNTELAAQQADGFRALANMIESHPELADRFASSAIEINMHTRTEDIAAELAEWARLAKSCGAKVTKEISSSMFNVRATFCGAVKVNMLAYRNEVCERVVTGTREVTEEIPDPDAPKVTVTRTVEDVDWVCRPLLASDTETAVA